MKEIGSITKVFPYKRYYEVTAADNKTYILFFEELAGEKYINGDVIEFDMVISPEFGDCVLNPKKIKNIYLEELKVHFKNHTILSAFVYEVNEGGFEVSYNGYRCFSPYYETVKKDYLIQDDILNSYQLFHVISIENSSVVLSKKDIIKSELSALRKNEIESMSPGFRFKGRVKKVQGFGVFISYRFSEGLLHVSNITDSYNNELDQQQKDAIQKKLEEVFTKGREVEVFVEDITDNRIRLNWNKETENAEITRELELIGLTR